MTDRRTHLLSTLPVLVFALLRGFHPLVAVPLVAGVLLPELDTQNRDYHRSWALHTFLVPAVVYFVASRAGVFDAVPWLLTALHFVAAGMALHFLADYVYPKEMSHPGAAWPVRPEGWSAPWGLVFMSGSWFVQWFAYLAPAFLPWVAGV